jgi:hypothetical protein
VAVIALQAAMNAVAKGLPVHGNAVPVRVLHTCVAMARQALRLRMQPARAHRQQQRRNPGNQKPAVNQPFRPAKKPGSLPTV